MNEGGMPVSEVLQSATLVNAKLLDKENQLGQIKEGFLADIVATEENALENVNTLTEVTFVMKNGVIYKNN
jgi:imidazolonepropionase-like amidohydrolase